MQVSSDGIVPGQRHETGPYCPYGKPLKILLVEDNPGDALLIERRFAQCSGGAVKIVHVDTLTTALLSLAQDEFDAIFLDLNLPDSDGLETVLLVLQQALNCAVIILSGDDQDQLAVRAIRLGAQDYFRKAQAPRENLYRIAIHAIERQNLRLALERRSIALERKRQNFHSLISNNADAMIVIDVSGKIRFANRAAEAMLGRKQEALLGSDFGRPIEGPETCEVELLAKDGAPFVAEMRVMQTSWENEPAFIASLRDITERKEAEKLLRIAKQSADLASRIKSQFLANISHELRTPLNAILGFADLLLMEVHGPIGHQLYRQYIGDIRRSGTDLAELINRLLDLSKAQAGALHLDETVVDCGAVLREAIPVYREEAAGMDIGFSYENAAEGLALTCDTERLRQVVDLLISNSLKFTEAGGRIWLVLALAGDGSFTIEVGDTGIGMPKEQLLRAFSAFERPDSAYATEVGRGPGLGLALSKTFVELHGGTIRLDSTENKGTRVKIRLPASRVSRMDTPNSASPESLINKTSITR